MDRNFQRALSLVLKHEGGWSDHPKDPGGATMNGVTLANFRRYVEPKATKDDLRKITDAQVERWLGLSAQARRLDKWIVCRVYAAARSGWLK